ncbi:hypothetical protein BC835DRAFT_1416372 [Cytidiella melzeri]|nr:hypothetical protein BC835DRAFT_1416372 [Cytidiella melzeri]
MSSTKNILPYLAAANPPRKAKRPRLDTDPVTTSTAAVPPRPRPQLLPKDDITSSRSPEHDSSDDEEDEYDPGEPAPAPKRRGRKPGPMSRSARESQRKLNHSRIEKARRTKINETLTTLSNLVNEAENQRALSADHVQAVPLEKEKAKGEKEFKLDVLVKTVTYIQELIHKVQTLEIQANSNACARCSQPPSSVSSTIGSPPSPGIKRKRAQAEHDEYTSSRPSSLPPPIQPHSSTTPSRRLTSASPALLPTSTSPCLPPISSWLPLPYLDPSSVSTLPSPSPDFTSHSQNPSSHLPTPPLSGSFRVPIANSTQALPALSLPGPAHPSLGFSSSFSQDELKGGMRISIPSRRFSTSVIIPRTGRSISQSPNWTPEDESAASLLLQMSTSPSSSGGLTTPRVHKRSLGTGDAEKREKQEGRSLQAETPSSLLGIGRIREKERA